MAVQPYSGAAYALILADTLHFFSLVFATIESVRDFLLAVLQRRPDKMEPIDDVRDSEREKNFRDARERQKILLSLFH